MSEESSDEDIIVFPEKISTIPFSELQELLKRKGSKATGEVLSNTTKTPEKLIFHRENKNRPREMSSKIPPFKNLIKSSQTSKTPKTQVDPRFHHNYGTFDQEKFEDNYKFLNNIKDKEKKILKKKLRNARLTDEERDKIKKLLQRMDNQSREEMHKKQETKLRAEEREYEIEELKQGRKPEYCKKNDEKLLNLVRKFEVMKEKGGLQKHIKRRRKKTSQKDKRKLSLINI